MTTFEMLTEELAELEKNTTEFQVLIDALIKKGDIDLEVIEVSGDDYQLWD